MFEELIEEIEDISLPFLRELQVELIDLKVRRQGRTVVIQILVDRPRGGITMDECATFNRKICEKIDAGGILPPIGSLRPLGSLREEEEYSLEVSSPGVDRPLKTKQDFLRNIGRHVRIHLAEPLDNRIEYEGRVDEILNNRVIINREKHSMVIPIEKIVLARQMVE